VPSSSKETSMSAASEKPAGATAVRSFRVEIPRQEPQLFSEEVRAAFRSLR
jgi:hypothetical protein